MFWMCAYPLLGQVGGVGPWNSQVFWAQNGTCPCNGYACIQNIMHGAVYFIGA